MTDHYRIKELEWKQPNPKYDDWESLYMYGRGLDWAQITDTINGYELSIDREYYDTLDQAKAAANEHHRREVEKMLSPVESGWIKTNERWPEEGVPVLVLSNGDISFSLCHWHDCGEDGSGYLWETYMFGPVSDPSSYELNDDVLYPLWQPLPPAPGGEV